MASKSADLVLNTNHTEERSINPTPTPIIRLKRFLPIKYNVITDPNPNNAEGNRAANSLMPKIRKEIAISINPNGG